MLRVGTSGWQYAHWRYRFYPQDVPSTRWLEYYADAFATVELNNSFYRLPKPDTFAAWATRVPDDFVFAVKASNYLTHYRRLKDPEEPVERLLAHAAPLRHRLGPVLLQLPPDLRAQPERLDATLRAFGRRVRVAVEFRHPSWFDDRVHDLLVAHGAALCLADRDGRPASPLWRTTDWAYVRLHHGTAAPAPCYGTRALTSWVHRLVDLWGPQPDGYVYFNNDPEACALRDAITFARLAEHAGCRTTAVPELRAVRIGARAHAGDSRTTSSGALSVR